MADIRAADPFRQGGGKSFTKSGSVAFPRRIGKHPAESKGRVIMYW